MENREKTWGSKVVRVNVFNNYLVQNFHFLDKPETVYSYSLDVETTLFYTHKSK